MADCLALLGCRTREVKCKLVRSLLDLPGELLLCEEDTRLTCVSSVYFSLECTMACGEGKLLAVLHLQKKHHGVLLCFRIACILFIYKFAEKILAKVQTFHRTRFEILLEL